MTDHAKSMEATEAGAIVMPPVRAFHLRPRTIDDLPAHAEGCALDLRGLPMPDVAHWRDPGTTSRTERD
jgi:3-polyprenyl-4-hydroxybenzoate decarboxylase